MSGFHFSCRDFIFRVGISLFASGFRTSIFALLGFHTRLVFWLAEAKVSEDEGWVFERHRQGRQRFCRRQLHPVGGEGGWHHQYDWATHFAPYFRRNAFAGIKSLHHLVFDAKKKEQATVREWTDSKETVLKLLPKNSRWSPTSSDMPPEIRPDGLSQERKQYLFDKIREFCPPYCQDVVCPDLSHCTPPSSPLSSISSPLTLNASPSPKRRCNTSLAVRHQ